MQRPIAAPRAAYTVSGQLLAATSVSWQPLLWQSPEEGFLPTGITGLADAELDQTSEPMLDHLTVTCENDGEGFSRRFQDSTANALLKARETLGVRAMADVSKLVTEFVDACNAHDPDKAVAFFAADGDYKTPSGVRHGTAEIRALLQAYVDATPDVHTSVEALVAQGPMAALEWTDTGTQTGPFRTPSGDLPPTGRRYTLRGASIIETKGDLIASWREYLDRLDLLTQLGFLPSQLLERPSDPLR